MFRMNGSTPELIQENHYYPFGLEMEGAWQPQIGVENLYQYNGKELNEDLGLNWNDYGARWYDASLGRWGSVDPLAEPQWSFSPYQYVLNNPVYFVDPTGMFAEEARSAGAASADSGAGSPKGLTEGEKELLGKLFKESRVTQSNMPPIRWKQTTDDKGNKSLEKVNGDGGTKRIMLMFTMSVVSFVIPMYMMLKSQNLVERQEVLLLDYQESWWLAEWLMGSWRVPIAQLKWRLMHLKLLQLCH
jgi:RHS repeat-associated protein